MKKVFVVGIGPGKKEFMTEEAINIVLESDFVVGYSKYIQIIKENFPQIEENKFFQTGMMKEVERCQKALELASSNKKVALVCSGDSGVYGMASLVLELSKDFVDVEIEIVAGVSAALSGGAVLGSPLTVDFMVLSLSNLLMSQEKIDKKLKASSFGDLVLVLYNPKSKNRPNVLKNACKILLEDRNPNTICGIVKNIGREKQNFLFTTLEELSKDDFEEKNNFEIDMFCTVFIGNSETKLLEHQNRNFMVNPRGYEK